MLPEYLSDATGLIDVKKLIRHFDEAEHARRADGYFQGRPLDSKDLFKPFMAIELAPGFLFRLHAVLQLMQPFPNAKVLDFGSGGGWLSRVVARLGMNAASCDIAQSALDLADAFTREREPDLVPRISYHLIEGARLPLPDASVDRILCFDALHHVPAYRPVLAEMARVLRPAGIAVFVEPDETHSRSEGSQAEMRNFGVIENDVDLGEIFTLAKEVGFVDGTVAMPSSVVPTLPVPEFLREVDRARRGETPGPAMVETVFRAVDPTIRSLRLFSLHRGGGAEDSSHIPHPQAPETGPGKLRVLNVEKTRAGFTVRLRVENSGPYRWLPSGGKAGSVNVGVLRRDPDGSLDRNVRRVHLPHGIWQPGGWTEVSVVLPNLPPGAAYSFDLVSEMVCWFLLTPEGTPWIS
ncbi:methyltransferase family protein [Humitalea rosea]|uniref:Methyltransferase family protein n=1 Tax=Humitalea rosea TaxID=990373 RepID=A0A2W7KJB0_9PROT|nr:methyltransferase family protein [Humitalea rosea]